MNDAIAWYEANSADVSARYEAVSPDVVHAWLVDMLPDGAAAVLDIGAGSGRDAAWLANKGYDVVAVEPSAAMRKLATSVHADARIHWLNDSLPTLKELTRAGLAFDMILLSAVWMHLPQHERPRAFRKLVNLLKPGGFIALTLRQGAAEPLRGIYPVSVSEIESLARAHGAFIQRRVDTKDELGRTEICWSQVVVRLPDDGSGALPLLRHIILNDDKSSTYKLALLRSLCRVADGAAGFTREQDDDTVAVPLGLVALTWIRLFKPLLAANLPQSPINIGYAKLGFVKEGFKRLENVSQLDLRVGMRFGRDNAAALPRPRPIGQPLIKRPRLVLPEKANIFVIGFGVDLGFEGRNFHILHKNLLILRTNRL